ncbi:MAG TPA: hypothetical protein VK283_04495 [Acidimicrobiales bacterium]|nr:hypothetical protein [Acidimicrobiales bacterium]
MAERDLPVFGQWDEEQPGLFLEGGEHAPVPIRRRRRRVAVVAATVMCLAVVGVPVGLVLTAGGTTPVARPAPQRPDVSNAVHLGNGPAEHQVLSALSATTASGNFDVTYDLTQVPASGTTPTTTCSSIAVAPDLTQVNGSAYQGRVGTVTQVCGGGGPQNASVSGKGTIDVDPYAMAVSADVSSFGNLSIRVDGTDYWELGAGDNGLAPLPNDAGPGPAGVTGSGSTLSSFAGLVEGTLGQREGALAMLGMASPTGFLDLSQQSVTGAAQVGTGQVGGMPVTEYEVSIDLSQLAQVPGITTDEATTIQGAVGVLDQSGYTGTMVKVAIDDAGFIREVTPVASFSDGGKVTLDAIFSNFGCAGTVLMPGQQGATAAPAGCVSPDSTTTTTTAPTTGADATTTTGPASTTTG